MSSLRRMGIKMMMWKGQLSLLSHCVKTESHSSSTSSHVWKRAFLKLSIRRCFLKYLHGANAGVKDPIYCRYPLNKVLANDVLKHWSRVLNRGRDLRMTAP